MADEPLTPDDVAPIDWSGADERTAAMVARLAPQPPEISAGVGMGMNRGALENMKDGGGGAGRGGGSTISLTINFDGTLRWVEFVTTGLQSDV